MLESEIKFYESAINHCLRDRNDLFNLFPYPSSTSPFNQDDYFDRKTGKFLGRGGTDEIRFIDELDWKAGRLDKFSTNGNILDNNVAVNVMRFYAKLTDQVIPHEYEFNIVSSGMSTNFINNKVVVSFGKHVFGGQIRNRYDAINFNEHETFIHGKQWHKYKKYTIDDYWNWEKEAVNHQINTSSWNKTSIDWKSTIYISYGKYEWIIPIPKQSVYFKEVELKPITYKNYLRDRYGVKINK